MDVATKHLQSAMTDETKPLDLGDGGSIGEILSPTTMPVIEESLEVSTAKVDQGGYRFTRKIEARNQIVDQWLRDQRIDIERRPMAVPLQSGELPEIRYEDDVLVMPVVEEVLVTEKRWVLVEEVRIRRIAGTKHHTQTVTLHRQDVAIERLEAESSSDLESTPPSA